MELKKVKPTRLYHVKVRHGSHTDSVIGTCIDNGYNQGRPIRTPVAAKFVVGIKTRLVPARNIIKGYAL